MTLPVWAARLHCCTPFLRAAIDYAVVVAAELLEARSSVTLAELHSTYMQTYNEQRQQQQQQGGPPQQQPGGQRQLRPVSMQQLQMALMQLTDVINVRGGVITKRAAAAGGGGQPPAEAAVGGSA
jgi:hypothetical protein